MQKYKTDVNKLTNDGKRILSEIGDTMVPTYWVDNYVEGHDDLIFFCTDSIRKEFERIIDILEDHNTKVIELEDELYAE